ncbi:MAG: transcriptional repressor LexA [Candidatus Gracilibacteria bacterium]|nr:transcriptional repressor LexA [Candidatus Gracilibacteria bacterium]
MNNDLSHKEKKVFEWIKEFQQNTGGYPTYRDIQEALFFNSINSVSQYIKQLAKKGYLELIKNRGYRLANIIKSGMIDLPLLGAVQAGGTNTTQEKSETMSFPAQMVPSPQTTFLLRVRGNSMSEAGIHEDDVVIVDRAKEAEINEVVVALLDGGNTVKRLVKDKETGKLYLKAESPDHPDIYPKREWQIQGVVMGLWRQY